MFYCALVAEPDDALRRLMLRAVSAAGFDVIESATVSQLRATLATPSVVGADKALLILAARLASACTPAIRAMADERASAGLPSTQLILTYEFGSLGTALDLSPGDVQGTLEKPFELSALQALATECMR